MEFTKEQKTQIKKIIAENANDKDKCLINLKRYLVELRHQFHDDYTVVAYTIWQQYANKRSR